MELENLDFVPQASEGPKESELELFLQEQREHALAQLLNESIERTMRSAEKRHWDSMLSDWDATKRRIIESISDAAVANALEESAMLSDRPATELLQRSRLSGATSLTALQWSMAHALLEHTDAQLENTPGDSLIARCSEAVVKHNEMDTSLPLWNALSTILKTPLDLRADIADQRENGSLRISIIEQSLVYLTDEFAQYMTGIVYSNLGTANLTDNSQIYNMVHSYLNVKMPMPYSGYEDDLLRNRHPLWAVVFCCLRAGSIEAALDACSESTSQTALDLRATLMEMSENKGYLPIDSEMKLKMIYRRQVRSGSDPYKNCVYALLCGIDLEDLGVPCDTLEHWLWFKLRVALSGERKQAHTKDAAVSGTLRLSTLQHIIREQYGEKYFQAAASNLVDASRSFSKALLLTGQLEHAFVQLFNSSNQELKCHALHLALSCYVAGLLVTPSDVQVKLLTDDDGLAKLNIARMVMVYTAEFSRKEPRVALPYLYMLNDLKSPGGESLFKTTVSDLILSTGEFELFLGSMNPATGEEKMGILKKFEVLNYDLKQLRKFVADDAERRALPEVALRLHDLAGNHRAVLRLMSDLLQQHIDTRRTPDSTRDRITRLAEGIAARYKHEGHTARGTREEADFDIMLHLAHFFEHVHEGRLTQAQNQLDATALLPRTRHQVNECIAAFDGVSECVRRVLPELLVTVLQLLVALQKAGADSGRGVGEGSGSEALRERANSTMQFAGRVSYRLPGNTSARLLQLQSQITVGSQSA